MPQDLKGKDAEVENLNNLLQMMQHQMRSAGTALENHVQVEQRILQEKIEKKQSQEEDDRQELLDQRIKVGGASVVAMDYKHEHTCKRALETDADLYMESSFVVK